MNIYTGGLLVGQKYCRMNEICQNVGGNCSITFLTQQQSDLLDTLDKALSLLIIEADTDEAVEAAACQVVDRISSLCIDRTQIPKPPKVVEVVIVLVYYVYVFCSECVRKVSDLRHDLYPQIGGKPPPDGSTWCPTRTRSSSTYLCGQL